MLKKFAVTTAAIAALATGAIVLDTKSADAGVSIQLVHGKGHGKWNNGKWNHGKHAKPWHFDGHRHGYYGYGRYQPFCFTKVRTKRVNYWSHRYHRWMTRTVRRPVTICR